MFFTPLSNSKVPSIVIQHIIFFIVFFFKYITSKSKLLQYLFKIIILKFIRNFTLVIKSLSLFDMSQDLGKRLWVVVNTALLNMGSEFK